MTLGELISYIREVEDLEAELRQVEANRPRNVEEIKAIIEAQLKDCRERVLSEGK